MIYCGSLFSVAVRNGIKKREKYPFRTPFIFLQYSSSQFYFLKSCSILLLVVVNRVRSKLPLVDAITANISKKAGKRRTKNCIRTWWLYIYISWPRYAYNFSKIFFVLLFSNFCCCSSRLHRCGAFSNIPAFLTVPSNISFSKKSLNKLIV